MSPFTLASRTSPRWAGAVAADLPALLSDHAHCELKAAASALSLLHRHGGRRGLAARVVPLLKEEADHLQRVLAELQRRGAVLRPDRKNPYAAGLDRLAHELDEGRVEPYLDDLLVSALIELRSHERFARLLECPALADLGALYRSLAEAEARHGVLFEELARGAYGDRAAEGRFRPLAAAEAVHLGGLPFAVRIHGGEPAP